MEKKEQNTAGNRKAKGGLMHMIAVVAAVIVLLLGKSGVDLFSSKDTGNTNSALTVNSKIPAEYQFRSSKLLETHYEKHGKEMGFSSASDYEAAASAVVTSEKALHKTEAEDGDDVYYIESTNEFVIVSSDGYIRTYFNPDGGKAYYDRQ